MRRSASDLLDENYGLVAKDLYTPLLDVLSVARCAGQGDLERAIILLEVAVRTVGDPRFSSQEVPRAEQYAPRSTNMRSIAESSGIPKETVRRKIAALVAEGLVLRRGNRLSLTPGAAPVLIPLRAAILKLAARNYETVSGLHERNA
jgi:hypothetical protein